MTTVPGLRSIKTADETAVNFTVLRTPGIGDDRFATGIVIGRGELLMEVTSAL